jgi:hypothetical protein
MGRFELDIGPGRVESIVEFNSTLDQRVNMKQHDRRLKVLTRSMRNQTHTAISVNKL